MKSGPTPLPPGVVVVDSHCHLADSAFDADREEVWQRAIRAGVAGAMIIGAGGGSASNSAAIESARRLGAYALGAVVGIHPHDAREASGAALSEIERLARDPIVRAIGETGLDFHYQNSSRAEQMTSLRAHIAIAHRAGKPLVIHCRNAYAELAQILIEERSHLPHGVVHCFTGTPSEARRMLDLGFALSFSGIVTFKNATSLREAARIAPQDGLLVETDAPFLAPVPLRGQRCEPGFVVETARRLAAIRNQDLGELCAATVENTRRCFSST